MEKLTLLGLVLSVISTGVFVGCSATPEQIMAAQQRFNEAALAVDDTAAQAGATYGAVTGEGDPGWGNLGLGAALTGLSTVAFGLWRTIAGVRGSQQETQKEVDEIWDRTVAKVQPAAGS